eukprot:TRINITY_DN1959_c0_g1_i3.p1 TRINITY_DN1959_c0_g1~~TRINITY_DN1959_c0_g1_i3.p1  ORF type:complete len:473 (-),score=85.12 TRINITY_DN1959_c0_g1_i3:30-1388(-)
MVSMVELAAAESVVDDVGAKPKRKPEPVFIIEEESENNGHFVADRLSNVGALYVGPIGVGTDPSCENRRDCKKPESVLWVVFDTGSTNIWISSDLCTYGPCSWSGRKEFNHTRSSTYSYLHPRTHLKVKFGTGMLRGPLAKDNFHIGPAVVEGQAFAMIEQQVGNVFRANPFEGIVGLAFPALATKSAPAFFDTVVRERVLDHNEFSLYLSRDNPSANAMFWGGVDPSLFEGKLEFFPVVDPYYWGLELVNFKIGAKLMIGPNGFASSIVSEKDSSHVDVVGPRPTIKPPPGPKAIVDTGTTYYTAEPAIFGKVSSLIRGTKCDAMTEGSHPNLTLTLRNARGQERPFIIPHTQYMVSHDGVYCTPGFMKIKVPAAHGPGMMLGEIFLKHHYAVFDRRDGHELRGRIGFAKSRQDATGIGRVMELTKHQPSFKEARSPSFLQAHKSGGLEEY